MSYKLKIYVTKDRLEISRKDHKRFKF